jgi:signal transduction histidine kinase
MLQRFRTFTSSIYIKILLGFAAILLLSLFLGYRTLGELRAVSAVAGAMTPRIENIQTLAEMRATINILQTRLSRGREGVSLEEIQSLTRHLEENLTLVLSRSSFGESKDRIAFEQSTTQSVTILSQLFGRPGELPPNDSFEMVRASLDDTRVAVDISARLIEEETRTALGLEHTLLQEAMHQLLTTQILILFLGMLLAMFLARMITSPIEILKESVLSVARGDYGAKVAIRSRDELGELASAFNDMSFALKKYTTSLEVTVTERTKELNEKIAALDMLTKELDESAQMLIRRDVALTRATERLEELDSVKSEFISVAAHQLRTPLSAIKWTLSLLLDGDAGVATPEQKELFEKALSSNERMIRLIEDMLTVTRIESGKATFVSLPVSLGELLVGLVQEVEKSAHEKGVMLTLAPVPQHRTILGDAEKLRAVFQNLLENALRYTPSSGKVSVTLVQTEHMIEVHIADSGIGIPEKDRANIFTKFFRADNAVKTVTDGTGLGLYVAKTIIERHHGTLRFESTEGKGTTFFATLPNEDAPFRML